MIILYNSKWLPSINALKQELETYSSRTSYFSYHRDMTYFCHSLEICTKSYKIWIKLKKNRTMTFFVTLALTKIQIKYINFMTHSAKKGFRPCFIKQHGWIPSKIMFNIEIKNWPLLSITYRIKQRSGYVIIGSIVSCTFYFFKI